MNRTFLQGAALLTITMFISKVLGFVYVIPFTNLVGAEGYILFEYAYKPYAIMISIATLGIPMAVSKIVSKYNELGDYETGIFLLKSGSILLSLTGIFWSGVLYFFAGYIAGILIDPNDTTGNSIEDVTLVIRTISFALILVPVMSLVRGFFQGNQMMQPTAISQTIEQIVRVTIILSSSFYIMRYGSGTVISVIGWSTFAASIAAVASMFVLYFYFIKHKSEFISRKSVINQKKPKVFALYKELILYSLPFLIISLAVPIFQNIDMFIINPTMIKNGSLQSDAEYVNSIVAMVQKVVTIPIIFANALALALVPAITRSFTARNKVELSHQSSKSFEIILFITIPSSIFMYLMPEDLFSFLLGTTNGKYGGVITKAYAFNSFFLSFFILTSAILQGINKHFFAVSSLFVGLIAKFSMTSIFVSLYGGSGTAYSTNIAFLMSVIINTIVIKKNTHFSIRQLIRKLSKIVIVSSCFAVSIILVKTVIEFYDIGGENEYIASAVKTIFVGVISTPVLLFVAYKLGLVSEYFSQKNKSKSEIE